jgi:hypothetical protein
LLRNLKQRFTFSGLKNHFPSVYSDLKALGDEPFVLPFWASVNEQTAAAFSPEPPYDFLGIPAIKNTMFVAPSQEWLEAEVNYLHERLGPTFAEVARENAVGKPQLVEADNGVASSANTLHHLYHIYRFLDETKTNLDDYDTVVEWGGGYGNFAKLWWRIKHGQGTFIIIDSALFTAIQWLYLSATVGSTRVNLLERHGDKIKPGMINLVPLALLDETDIQGDLFVSTWGLSESSDAAQDYVVNKQWFGCPHLLIGHQEALPELPNASRLGDLAKKDGAKSIDIEFIPHNHYAFK